MQLSQGEELHLHILCFLDSRIPSTLGMDHYELKDISFCIEEEFGRVVFEKGRTLLHVVFTRWTPMWSFSVVIFFSCAVAWCMWLLMSVSLFLLLINGAAMSDITRPALPPYSPPRPVVPVIPSQELPFCYLCSEKVGTNGTWTEVDKLHPTSQTTLPPHLIQSTNLKWTLPTLFPKKVLYFNNFCILTFT